MSDIAVDVQAADPVEVEPVVVEVNGGQVDVLASGRPDPNVRTPAKTHRMTQGDDTFAAHLFTQPPGWAGDGDVWQILQDTPDGQALILGVAAKQIPDAIAENQERADQWRAQAQILLDRAANADREVALLTALAGAEGIKGGDTAPVSPVRADGRGVRRHPAPVETSTGG